MHTNRTERSYLEATYLFPLVMKRDAL